jgi:hypothetical protein
MCHSFLINNKYLNGLLALKYNIWIQSVVYRKFLFAYVSTMENIFLKSVETQG